jgi:hypothetical protein
MLEALFSHHPEYLIPICAILGGTLVAVITVVAHHWRKVRQGEAEAALKQDMLTRGLSVDEIERVIRASNQDVDRALSDNEAALVHRLAKEGKSGEEIERVIRALKGSGGAPHAEPRQTDSVT